MRCVWAAPVDREAAPLPRSKATPVAVIVVISISTAVMTVDNVAVGRRRGGGNKIVARHIR